MLQFLVAQDWDKLAELRGLENLGFMYLDVSGCDSLGAIPNFSRTHVIQDYEECPYDYGLPMIEFRRY
ncbi:hypothetical protein EUGRSUZ_B01955 [Eucalyptus grandis]|uniref:Uncharacterized protein n=2 Tax=Eucalyptus grandis TaxID=71139 RepID=A0ACC3LT54_EUCGR|nr:hypothetical protein EUGRSUZ_B01955 [Eucalyptus grandis]